MSAPVESNASAAGSTVSGLTTSTTQPRSHRGPNRRYNNRYRGRGGGARGSVSTHGTGMPSCDFEGSEPMLKGFIYDYTGTSNLRQYNKTTEAIENFCGGKYPKFKLELVEGLQQLKLENPKEPVLSPEVEKSIAAQEVFKIEIKEYREKLQAFSDFRIGLYTLIMGQCTESMKSRLESHKRFEDLRLDGIKLLALVRDVMQDVEDSRVEVGHQVVNVLTALVTRKQKQGESLHDYYKEMVLLGELAESAGVELENQAIAMEIAKRAKRSKPNQSDLEQSAKVLLARLYINGTQSSGYCDHLMVSYLDGHDVYPSTIHEAHHIMQRRPDAEDRQTETQDGVTEGVSFVNSGMRASPRPPFACFRCQSPSHPIRDCPLMRNPRNESGDTDGAPNGTTSGTALVNNGNEAQGSEGSENAYSFSVSGHQISPTAILLDSQSNVDLFCNKNMLSNMRTVPKWMSVKCNAGTIKTNLMGDLKGYGPVWYYADGAANILSLAKVEKKFQVEYYPSGNEKSRFIVYKPDGVVREFIEHGGLYVYDAGTDVQEGMMMVTTVEDNRSNYSQEDYLRAKLARQIQVRIGRPSTKEFIRIVSENLMPNCPVTKADIVAAEHIFGPEVGSLKGKTTRRAPHQVPRDIVAMLPEHVHARYRHVTLCVDVMFVNRIPFLVTISRHIRFGTVEPLQSRNQSAIIAALQSVIQVYRRGGFQVIAALMDGEFAPLGGELAALGVALNTTAQDEHVGEVERYIRTVKERMRATYNTLPFRHIPARIVIEMARAAIYWLNAFPSKRGVSQTMSPRMIVTGQSVDYTRHCKHEFGEYVQTHEEHGNDMAPRTVGALALRPTGNAQGSWYYFSLSTGRVLNRMYCTPLPMPAEVVAHVHRIARQQKANPGLAFSNRQQLPHPDSDYNSDTDSDYEDEDEETVALDDTAPVIASEGVTDSEVDEDENSDQPAEVYEGNDEDEDSGQPAEVYEGTEVTTLEGVREGVTEAPRSEHYNLRARKPRDFAHLFLNNADAVEPLVTAQMSMRQGMKAFGEEGVQAIRKELQQLHDRQVMEGVDAKELSAEQRRNALAYLMFLKRKRCGTIKARGCADGRKQRAYTSKEDAASPTVATEAIFLTAVIEALEGREVAVVDVPGAFMQADMDELVHVRFTGKMVDMLIEINHESYAPYITEERGEKVMYVKLLKALYGTLRAARLFWEKLTAKLLEWGFEANPYDACVCNKMVDGKQLTVAWHVDDLKISHVDTGVVDEFIERMNAEFGKETHMNISRGRVHDYLGMIFDFSVPGEVKIDMTEYVKNILHHAPGDKEMRGEASTPAANHLFEISEHAQPLDDDRKAEFVTLVMQCLYLSQRARPDIRTAISFLSGRLQNPDEDDWKKMGRVIKYLRGTTDLGLTLRANGSGVVQWWVDASFAVHKDMKGHSGGTLSLGQGCLYSTSTKQKLVTRSSTESEVVGVHDVLPQVLWTGHFLKAQGFEVKDTKLYQDNMSSILLEKNGRSSSTRRTRHMEIRYFFIKDKVSSKEVTIEYCPTDDMVADFFTKPLQGIKFKKFRALLMNVAPGSKYSCDQRSVLEHEEESVPSSEDRCDIAPVAGIARWGLKNKMAMSGELVKRKVVRFAKDVVERGSSLLASY